MSAGFSQNQRSTGGHRPPLQETKTALRQFCNTLCEEGNVSERESSNDLAGSRLCTTVERSAWRIAAVDPIDVAVSGCEASVLEGRRRSRIRPGERYTERAATDRNRAGQEQPVKDVLEVG